MRIGVFHPTLNMYGGAPLVAVVTANVLARNGFEVTLFVNSRIDQKRTEEMAGAPLNQSIRTIVKPIFLPQHGKFHLYESAARSLLFKCHCDLLIDTYSNCVYPWANITYIHFPYLNNYDFKLRFPYLKQHHLQHILTIPYAIIEKNLEDYAGKLLLANSRFTAKAIREYLGVDSAVLYPPITNVRENSLNLELPREDLVLTVARFGAGKGIEKVPEIAYRTKKSIKFVIIGFAHDLSIVNKVKKEIVKLDLDNRITVITNASNREIIAFLSKAKVYLHPTEMEHFGISIVEAMASGCLPVVHNSGGPPEFVPDQYRYNTFQEAAEIVDAVIDQWTPELGYKMARIAERFSEENFSKRFMQLFNEYFDNFLNERAYHKRARNPPECKQTFREKMM